MLKHLLNLKLFFADLCCIFHKTFSWDVVYISHTQLERIEFNGNKEAVKVLSTKWSTQTTESAIFKSITLSTDHKLLAVAVGCDVELLEAATGKKLYTFKEHTAAVTIVHFSCDGSILCSGDENGTFKMWRIEERYANVITN